MADAVYFNVAPNFDLHMFAGQLAEKYRMEGFTVTVADFNNAEVITFDKDTGGINMLLGLGRHKGYLYGGGRRAYHQFFRWGLDR